MQDAAGCGCIGSVAAPVCDGLRRAGIYSCHGRLAGVLRAGRLGYTHEPHSQRAARARGEDPGDLLPGVHRVASLAKRWLLGTHQGSVDDAHLPSYLDEFVFRFNRRRSRSRGMVFYRVLELAVDHDPVRYRDLIARPQPQRTHPTPPATHGHPPTLERPPAGRPGEQPTTHSG